VSGARDPSTGRHAQRWQSGFRTKQEAADHPMPGRCPRIVGGVETERPARAGGGDDHGHLVAGK
jgi:hypothetical protein